ncbi:MAG: HAMP domain-containing histidine kinase [Planctomycetes bacterium]|nr:HAMP domain-containing histidine kinase [Planctomycetota bacterium]
MRPRLAAILTIIVLTPLALIAWIGARGVLDAREAVSRRHRQLLVSRLEDASSRLAELLSLREREILRGAEGLALEAEALRSWLRGLPFASAVFLLGPDRKLQFPPPDGPMSDAERELLARAQQVLRDRGRFFQDPETPASAASGSEGSPPAGSDRPKASGWYAWFWGGDVQLAFWQRVPTGGVLGVELNRSRFLADAIAASPPGESLASDLGADRIRLVDSRGETLHQWGSREPEDPARPAAELPLAQPLSAWRLQCFSAGTALEASLSRGLVLQLLLGLSAVGLVLVGLAFYFARESSRDLRDARQRVTFVNQVSHELKTPLTNIRMYAELLQRHLGAEAAEPTRHGGGDGEAERPAAVAEQDSRLREYAGVIVEESHRLSRLIANILTFGRKQRDALRLHRRPGVVDETIAAVIERFRLALEAEGIEARFTGGAPRRVSLDPDALEQILNNLLSNVQKHAPRSGLVEVSSRQDGATTTILVVDRGPGIPERHREEVFVPFRRLSDRLTEGASGTGLGLSIARDLARLHGGAVRVLPSEAGARLEVVLETGPQEDPTSEEGT